MSTLSFSAAAHRFALLLGVADVNEVVAWADSEISQVDSPPVALIDVAMGRQSPTANLIDSLSQLVVDANDTDPLKHSFRSVANAIRMGAIDADAAILRIYKLLDSTGLLYDDDFVLFTVFEDDLSLIRDGIFGDEKRDEVRRELLAALDRLSRSVADVG